MKFEDEEVGTPEIKIEFRKTQRGFAIAEFKDLYGSACSIQESSKAFEDCIWLGVHENRMHLNQQMVAALLPALQHFVKTGNLPE